MSSDSATSSEPEIKHPVLLYSAARLGLLLLVGAVFWLLGLREIPLIVCAFLVSAVLSYVLLSRSRGAVGQRMSAYFSRLNQKIDASSRAEDELLDAAPASESESPAEVDLSARKEPVKSEPTD